jgi:trigger factor
MDVTFQNIDAVSGLLTIKLEKADYQNQVDKSLKTYRQKVHMNGFRQGMVPLGLVKKMYGAAVKSEEINKIVSHKIYDYIKENNLKTLGEPLPDEEKQQPVDFENMDDFEFFFDIALSPEFKAEISKKDKLNYYTIEVSDKMLDDQINMYRNRLGEHKTVDSYADKDMLKGTLVELGENGEPKEGGILVEDAVMMPDYMKADDQKKLFAEAKVGTTIVFNPSKAYEGNDAEIASLLKVKKEEVADMKSDFSYAIKEITRFFPGDIDQKLFDSVYGKDAVKSEEEFRGKVKEDIARQLTPNSDYKLLLDVKALCEKKIGKLEFPDKLLKKIMLLNNKDKDEKFVDDNYDNSIKALLWQLVKEQLVEANGVKVENEDITKMCENAARAQFAQYGMPNVPDDLLKNYVGEMMKKKDTVNEMVDRAVDEKLIAVFKEQLTLTDKTVSSEEFNKLLEK